MKSFEQSVLKSIAEFLGPGLGWHSYMEKFTPKSVPVWAKDFAEFYRVDIDAEKSLILVRPKESSDIEKIINLYRVLKNLKHEYVLIIADDFSSKSKKDLLKGRIPHMTSTGSIFAPELGVIYKDKIASSEKKFEYTERLTALAQKLAAAYLIDENFFKKHDTFSALAKYLSKNGYSKSISSISRAFQQLAQVKILKFEGNGPHKCPIFYNRDVVWSRLLELEAETVIKKTGEFYFPEKKKYHWVYSNDSALSRISDLNHPNIEIIAMNNVEFKKWKQEGENGTAISNFGGSPGVIIEVWRDDVEFLSKQDCLNPIELALSLRRTREPRTQLALSKVIDEVGLNSKLLWERK